MTTLGAVFLPYLPPERLRSIVEKAEECGLEELWLWEDCFRESGIATAAAALAWSDTLRVGVGLLPVPLRNVAATAMEIATLERLFPGRVRIAVGHGAQDWMHQVNARVESPLTLLREYLDALRALLRGETVSTEGRYVTLRNVTLDWPPERAPEILAGAIGPRSMRLVGGSADGAVVVAGTSPAALTEAISLLNEGAHAASRPEPVPVVLYVHAATGPTADERMEGERERWGYESTVDRVVTGDAKAIAAAVRTWAAAGAQTVILQPTPDEPDLEGFIEMVARDIRPLVD
ncbi:LLM class flavin-dependent oxidoreductase [Virgisporangium aliadipatigenens]|nr:LLM class flavin-dependent oxidoreductase [Virgisporangium aliadipatigenens]